MAKKVIEPAKLVVTTYKQGPETSVEFMGYEGYLSDDIEEDIPSIIFTFNVAPGEEGGWDTKKDLVAYLGEQEKLFREYKDFVKALGPEKYIVGIIPNFYWSEEDLNIRIEVLTTSPTFKHLFP